MSLIFFTLIHSTPCFLSIYYALHTVCQRAVGGFLYFIYRHVIIIKYNVSSFHLERSSAKKLHKVMCVCVCSLRKIPERLQLHLRTFYQAKHDDYTPIMINLHTRILAKFRQSSRAYTHTWRITKQTKYLFVVVVSFEQDERKFFQQGEEKSRIFCDFIVK